METAELGSYIVDLGLPQPPLMAAISVISVDVVLLGFQLTSSRRCVLVHRTELIGMSDLVEPDLLQPAVQVAERRFALRPSLRETVDLSVDLGESVAALVRNVDGELLAAVAQGVEVGVVLIDLIGQLINRCVEFDETTGEQFAPPPGEVDRNRLVNPIERVEPLRQPVLLSELLHEGRQQLELITGSYDGVVGACEVVEVADERLDALGHVEWLEHVGPYELIEIVDRLHRHRLVEQVESLVGLDAEPPAHIAAVVGEVVVDPGTQLFQPLTELLKRVADLGEVVGDREVAVGHHVEAFGL